MKKNRIRRSDYSRVLVTETIPFETPIVFSNDGLYDQVTSLNKANDIQKLIVRALVFGESPAKQPNSTVPYTYKVKKNSMELRRLALLHPLSQWQIKCFYEKYERLIIHYCSASPASIRAPKKVAGSYFSKSSWENINQYKNGTVTTEELDQYAKHAPSFFAYRGYDRLYKFFNSRDYFDLEKRFSVMKTLDVSKCFDSIYTHCLSWAVKDKPFTKENVDVSSTFAQRFDETIRHGNHNETNGIPIGPEVSRIFAEILFQEIDRRVIDAMSDLKFSVDYAFRRYVDDVFIFARTADVADRIYRIYADCLVSFNLHANSAKSVSTGRPFSTAKSRLVYDAGRHANEFFDKFLEQTEVGALKPKSIHASWRLTKNYIDAIKALCFSSQASYDEIASYLISVTTERIKRLVNVADGAIESDNETNYVDALDVLLNVQFFLYGVAPSVGASYKLSTSLILASRFSTRHLPARAATVHQKIFDLAAALLLDNCGVKQAEGIDGFVHLELLNIALAIRELGDSYLLPPDVVKQLFIDGRKLSYFTIVSLLFYVRDAAVYADIRTSLVDAARVTLSDLSDVLMSSEKANMLLDLLHCPYVPVDSKRTWVKGLFSALQLTQPNKAALQAYLTTLGTTHALVDWSAIDLLNSLEKKELKQAY